MQDLRTVHAELDRVRVDFHRLLADADAADLARATQGPRWTNQELLFHMLFGYLIVCALLPPPRDRDRNQRPVAAPRRPVRHKHADSQAQGDCPSSPGG